MEAICFLWALAFSPRTPVSQSPNSSIWNSMEGVAQEGRAKAGAGCYVAAAEVVGQVGGIEQGADLLAGMVLTGAAVRYADGVDVGPKVSAGAVPPAGEGAD